MSQLGYMSLLSCLLPTTAESFVDSHDACQFRVADLRQTQFGLEKITVGIERLSWVSTPPW